jgi:glycosyltransferase involved in cell wall biosynthesis
MRQYLFKKAFVGVRLIMANSQAQLAGIEHLAPSLTPKKVIRIGIRSAALKSVLSTPSVSPLERPYILFPRMMQPIYQHDAAIDALRLLPTAICRKFAFVFLDQQGPNEAYCRLIQHKMDALPELRFIWLPRLEKSELWHYLKHAALCVQIPSSDGSAVSALEAMFLGCPLLLGPANYDADLFSTIPRTSLMAKEISQKIESLLAHPHMDFPGEQQLESATDEALQSAEMEKELLRLIQ